MNVCVDRNHIVVLLTHESAGDVFGHLVTRAAHLWQVRQLSVQHPFKLQHKTEMQVSDVRCDTTAGFSTVWIMTLLLQIKNNAFLISYDEKQHKYIYDVCWSENPGNHNGISYFHIIRDEVILSCLYVG